MNLGLKKCKDTQNTLLDWCYLFFYFIWWVYKQDKNEKKKKKKHPRKSIIFEKQEQALLAYCHFHPLIFYLSENTSLHCTRKQRLRLLPLFSREINHRMYQIYKEDGVVNRFLTARRHFWPPWSERTHYMENGQSVSFFLSPHLPYVFGHVKLTGLLLRCSDPSLNQFGKKKTRLFCSLIIMQIEENVITASEISIILHIIIQK